jgi:hypothetical protein
MFMIYALEYSVHFLSEKRTELYEQYCSGVSQMKNVLSAKNDLHRWALPNLERRGA